MSSEGITGVRRRRRERFYNRNGDASRLVGIALAALMTPGGAPMKTRIAIVTASILTAAMPLIAAAQAPATTETRAAQPAWMPEAGQIDSSKLVGMKVKNDLGKDIGEIDALIIDQSKGQVSHVVVGRGGLLGVGEKKVVLNWNDLTIQSDPNMRGRMVAQVSQSKLDTAPLYQARRGHEVSPSASPSTVPSQPAQPHKKY
jgi:sporulation protein YlmC with PRC-barrel domain